MMISEVSSSAPAPAMGIPLDESLTLLRRAASDEEFRHELRTRPAETLALLGFDITADDLPNEISLPSRSTLEETVEKQASLIDWLELVKWRFQPPRA